MQAWKKLLGAAACSNLADGMRTAAFPLLLAGMTSSPLVISLASAAAHLPWVFFALYAGLLVDSRGARKILQLSQVSRALLILAAIAIAFRGEFVLVVLVIIFALGILEVFTNTAEPTYLPSLVEAGDLPKTNARLSAIELVMNSFLGVALGALLFGIDSRLPLLVMAVGYSAAYLLISAIPKAPSNNALNAKSEKLSLLGGVSFIRKERLLLILALITGIANFSIAGIFSVLILYVKRFGEDTTFHFAAVLTAISIGSVLALTVVGHLRPKFGDSLVLRLAIVIVTCSLAGAVTSSSPVQAFISFVFLGVAFNLWGSIAVSFRQEVVPGAILGRVNAFYRLVAYSSAPLGAVFTGAISEYLGIDLACKIIATLSLLCWPLLPLISQKQFIDLRFRSKSAKGAFE